VQFLSRNAFKSMIDLVVSGATGANLGRLSGRIPNPAVAGCNSDQAQYSNTPSLYVAGFEDENEAPFMAHPFGCRTQG
jgi:hypothetical protein